ncbi:MAG: hypothetical protein L6Q75_19650 [Burkholderiaceae bacterium]|nr:hypothetical protein [Burkholderiaceae bacterium]
MPERRCAFVDEVLAAAGDEAAQRRLRLVLARWAGQRVYVRAPDGRAPEQIAAQLLAAAVTGTDAVRILQARTGRSERQCWRYLRRAADSIGRTKTAKR